MTKAEHVRITRLVGSDSTSRDAETHDDGSNLRRRHHLSHGLLTS
jgi:hypothetical protein